jgi:hypothetical protein
METARNFEVIGIYLFASANIYTGLPMLYSRLLICAIHKINLLTFSYILIY